MRKFVLVCFLIIFALSTAFSLSASASPKSIATEKIFVVSRGGETSEFPQNSLEAIEACLKLDIDAVSATVRKTADGKLIIFESESTKGICVDENGKSVDKKVSETEFEILSSYYLLSSENENLSRSTKSKIALLDDVLNVIKGRLILIIDCEEEILDDIYNKLLKNGFLSDVIFRCREMKNKNLLTWANSKEKTPSFIPSYSGNVIFSAIGTYNFAEKNNASLCEFSTKNRYGVIYSDFFTKRFDSVKVLAPAYSTELCGNRPDSILGWENLIKSGYSAIETENAKELSSYISLLNESYSQLAKLYNDAKGADLTAFSSASTKNFQKHLKTAESILTSDKASSQDEINSCIENIRLSSADFEKTNGEDNKAFSVTPMKIFWIAFAIALFVSSQVYLHKKTKKI